MGSYSHDGVDMSIGIIADEIAMVEPFHLACMEEIFELSVDVILGERLVAVRGEEALGCRKNRSLAIALDASTFQDESRMVFQGSVEGTLVIELEVDGIVFLPCELLAPTIKLEIEQVDRDDERVLLVA